MTTKDIRVLIRGAGDLATGVAHRMHRSGFTVFMTELAEPKAVRRTVAFSDCVFRGEWSVEGVKAVRTYLAADALRLKEKDPTVIPVIVDPEAKSMAGLSPHVLIDARMPKRYMGTTFDEAPIVIGLGPGFSAGANVHAVIETARGHYLGRVIYEGEALAHTGVPQETGGYDVERVLRGPCEGSLRTLEEIGNIVTKGQVLAEVVGDRGLAPVRAAIPGTLRGLLRDGAPVTAGQKIGDVDPRSDTNAVWYISDKARAIGGGVLEAVLCMLWGGSPLRWITGSSVASGEGDNAP